MDLRFAVTLGMSFLIVVMVVGFYVARALRDECYDWEVQLDQVDEGVTQVLRLEGAAREAGLDELEQMAVPCAKVAKVRDLCTIAYRHLLEAQIAHDRAEALLPRVQQALDALDAPLRQAARRCVLQDQPDEGGERALEVSPEERAQLEAAVAALEPDLQDVARRCIFQDQRRSVIARDLDLDEAEVRRRLSTAMNQIGLGNVVTAHREVEDVIERSDRDLAEAEASNQRCDEAYKRLRAERGR